MSFIVTYWLLSLLTLLVCLAAIWKGGAPERSGAVVILSLVILGRVVHALVPTSLGSLIGLADDALTALGLLYLTVRYASLWLGGCMLFYASTFVLHSFYLVTARPEADLFYYWMNDINFAGIHICLVLGTITSWRLRVTARGKPLGGAVTAAP